MDPRQNGDVDRYYTLASLLINHGTSVLQQLLIHRVKIKHSKSLKDITEDNNSVLHHMKKSNKFFESEEKVLFASNFDHKKVDLTLVVKLLRKKNLSGVTGQPDGGWKCLPDKTKTSLPDQIARIHHYRNFLCHQPDTFSISESECEEAYDTICYAIIKIEDDYLDNDHKTGICKSKLDEEIKHASHTAQIDSIKTLIHKWREEQRKSVNIKFEEIEREIAIIKSADKKDTEFTSLKENIDELNYLVESNIENNLEDGEHTRRRLFKLEEIVHELSSKLADKIGSKLADEIGSKFADEIRNAIARNKGDTTQPGMLVIC